MPLSNDTLPQKPLNGQELKEIIVAKFRDALDKDCMFLNTVTYARVAFTAMVTVHTSHPAMREFEVRTRTRPSADLGYEGEVPLKDPPPDAQLVALERTVDLENPNLERVHAGLPIKTVTRKGTGPATPGDPFPAFETHEIRYDPHDYPPPPEPKDEDVSLREARRLGLMPDRAVTPDIPGATFEGPLFKNVKDFGAKGDGKTDDAAAIRRALTETGRKVAHIKPLKGEDPDLIKGPE